MGWVGARRGRGEGRQGARGGAVKKPKARAAQRGQERVRRAGARGKDRGLGLGGVW